MTNSMQAEVIAVHPNKVKIAVDEGFITAAENIKIGSYLRISDKDDVALLAMVDNFLIEVQEKKDGSAEKKYIIEANPLGVVEDGVFTRGGDSIALPPKKVELAKESEILSIYHSLVKKESWFEFSKLSSNDAISVPVDGNKFFNKHIAIVGSTGSGKSHTVSKIIQNAISSKNADYEGLNNSHIIIFDIHSEYASAFPESKILNINELKLPYWMLNSEELEELFLDTEANDHNQRNVFKEAITANKKIHSKGDVEQVHYDTPAYFSLEEVHRYITYRNTEKKDKKSQLFWKKGEDEFVFNEETKSKLFDPGLEPAGTSAGGNNGKLINFLNRLENKIYDKRLDFLVGEDAASQSFQSVVKSLLGYEGAAKNEGKSNVTIIDLSGVPFEVLSITVSLISRIMFEYGYFSKKGNNEEKCDCPFLLVYEEAHKYVPKSGLSKFRASRESIERIAKEGRKYGVTLMLASQRPSELSETIFSQCSNFLAMRLTNPNDQGYVKKLLPDTLGSITEKLPSLQAGEALLLGESVAMPSVVQIDRCDENTEPSSNDIQYLQLWKEQWKDINFSKLEKDWLK